MHIAYVSQYFPPEMGAPSARVYELSREWVKQGHRVTVITAFSNHPTGIKSSEDEWKLSRREKLDGIEILRTYIFATPNKGAAKRMMSFATFMSSAAIIGAYRGSTPDIVIATSPQLLCGLSGYFLSRFWSVPFVFEVRDLWPESMLAVEIMRENIVIKGLRQLSRFLYRSADSIVTVGEGYRSGICRGYNIPSSKIIVVPNGVDMNLYKPETDGEPIRKEYGWKEKFVILYLGTHGMAHGLDHVLEAARILRGQEEILFAFVGEGAEKEKLQKMASDMALENVQFIAQQPKHRVPQFYAACDLGLVCLRNSPLFQEVLPSKIFEFLGMAKPILLMVDGESRRLVEDANAGVFVQPGDASALATTILSLVKCPEHLKSMGDNGRVYVAKRFSRVELSRRYVTHLETVVSGLKTPSNTLRADSD